jgi:predicted nucleotidyltransferase
MILTEHRLGQAVQVLRSMGAKRVVLFGTCSTDPARARDVDLAVEDIPLAQLLDADLRVQEALRAPTDLVSREENPSLYDIVVRYGRVLYEQRQADGRDRART